MKIFNTGKLDIAYDSKGPAGGPPVVFLHGATVDHVSMENTFEPYFRGRGVKHRRIYPDLPGHGASGHPLGRASMRGLLEDTEAFLSGNFTKPPALVGYSLGGFLALKLAEKIRFPSIFLIVPPVCSDRNRVLRPEAVTVVSDELSETGRRSADTRYLALAVKKNERTLKSYKAGLAKGFSPGRLAFQARLIKGAGAENISIEPGLISSRTVFLTGRQDTLAGYRSQFELFSKLKNSEYHSFYDCGHFLPFECDEFGTLFQEWLRLGTENR